MSTDSYADQEFAPVNFDGNKDPSPDVAEGKYRFKVEAAEGRPTKGKNGKPKRPMVVITTKALKTYDVNNPKAVKSKGGEVSDFLVIMDDNEPNSRMAKIRYREYCDVFGLKYDVMPKQIASTSDMDPFIEAILGKKFDGWVTYQPSDNGEPRATLWLHEPPVRDEVEPADDDEEEEEEADEDDDAEADDEEEDEEEPEVEDEEEEEEEEEEDEDEEDEAEEPPAKAKKSAKVKKSAPATVKKGAVTQAASPRAKKSAK